MLGNDSASPTNDYFTDVSGMSSSFFWSFWLSSLLARGFERLLFGELLSLEPSQRFFLIASPTPISDLVDLHCFTPPSARWRIFQRRSAVAAA